MDWKRLRACALRSTTTFTCLPCAISRMKYNKHSPSMWHVSCKRKLSSRDLCSIPLICWLSLGSGITPQQPMASPHSSKLSWLWKEWVISFTNFNWANIGFVPKGWDHELGAPHPWIFSGLPPPAPSSPALHWQPPYHCRGSSKPSRALPRKTKSKCGSNPASPRQSSPSDS